MKEATDKNIRLEDYFFIKNTEIDAWDYLLEQIGIPEKERSNIDSIRLEVIEIEYEKE